MVEKLKSSLIKISKGVVTPIIVIFVFSLTLGLFLSLTLLVISIEEGTGNLSDSAMSMTWAVFLFAQGVGLSIGDCLLTIVPLGITLLLVASLIVVIRKIQGGALAYFTGFVVWVAVNAVLSQNTHVVLADSLIIILCKTAVIYLISLFIAVFPSSSLFAAAKKCYKQVCPERVQKNISIVKRTAVLLFVLYSLVALVTVIVWSCTHVGSVNSFFIKLGMQNGSRILTTIACLVWLPNVAIWALSWICGAGFSIGKVAYFTIAAAQNKDLPPVPVFGIFPESIGDVVYRTLFYGIIPTVCFILMLVMIFHKRGCCLRIRNIGDKEGQKDFILGAIEAASDCVGVVALITVMWTIVFACANGSLGQYRLSFVGVDVIESTRAVGHLTLYAVGAAWLLAIVGILLAHGVKYIFGLIHIKSYFHGKDADTTDTDAKSRAKSDFRSDAKSVDAKYSASKVFAMKDSASRDSASKDSAGKNIDSKEVDSKDSANESVGLLNNTEENKLNLEIDKLGNNNLQSVKSQYAKISEAIAPAVSSVSEAGKFFAKTASCVSKNIVKQSSKIKGILNLKETFKNKQSSKNKNLASTKVPRTAISSNAGRSKIDSEINSEINYKKEKQKSPLSLKKAAPRTVSSKAKRK